MTIDDWSKHNTHASGFGSGKRSNMAQSKDGPGPGNYNCLSKDMHNAPSYTLAARKDNKYFNYNPGPGAYNPDVSAARET
jgi:Sperm-tail PG-rich repeat